MKKSRSLWNITPLSWPCTSMVCRWSKEIRPGGGETVPVGAKTGLCQDPFNSQQPVSLSPELETKGPPLLLSPAFVKRTTFHHPNFLTSIFPPDSEYGVSLRLIRKSRKSSQGAGPRVGKLDSSDEGGLLRHDIAVRDVNRSTCSLPVPSAD